MFRHLRFVLPLLGLFAAQAARAADDPYVDGGPRQPPLPLDNVRFATANGEPTKMLGGGGGERFVAACPAGQALIGWQVNAGLQLAAVGPICQRVVEGDLLGVQGATPTVLVGTHAADERVGFAMRCVDHASVRGMEAAVAPDGSIHSIRSVCHVFAGSGVPVAGYWSAIRLPKGSTGDYLPKDRRGATCTGGYATGLVGTYSGEHITSIGLTCLPRTEPGSAPAPAPPRLDRSALRAATVKLSVDVYPAPGGDGQSTGTLEAGTAGVVYVEACRGDWCHVRWPDGEGWVYSGQDYNALGR